MFESLNELVEFCEKTVVDSPYVSLDLGLLPFFYDSLKNPRVYSVSYMLHPQSKTPTHWLFDFTFNASLNGGYYYEENNEIKKWEHNGSGTQALTVWADDIRHLKKMPFYDITNPCVARTVLQPHLTGIPFAEKRLKILSEFSETYRFNLLDDFVETYFKENTIVVNFELVNKLVEIYPSGFIDDPFKKKAILALIFFTDMMENYGKTFIWEAGFPVDYQIPRILSWVGVIKLSNSALLLLNNKNLLPIKSMFVTHYRAAALLAVEKLSKQTGVPSKRIDGVLFNEFRRNPLFIKESPPNMKIDDMWF